MGTIVTHILNWEFEVLRAPISLRPQVAKLSLNPGSLASKPVLFATTPTASPAADYVFVKSLHRQSLVTRTSSEPVPRNVQ